VSRLTVAFVLGLCVAAGAMADEPGGDPAERLARPTPGQVAYHNLEVQAMLHWSPATWQGREYDNRSTPPEAINPDALDTDQWCEAARSFGAKQIVFVAKHASGFCWWQTETADYGVRQLPWREGKADVLAELADSCRRSGLKLGIYVYPGDDRFGAGIGSGGRTKDPARQEEYNRVFRQQLTEVLTRYGEIGAVWFDGSCRIEVGDILAKHAPGAMVFQGPQATLRWVGNEEGIAPYPAWQTVRRAAGARGLATAAHGDPDGDLWMPLVAEGSAIGHKLIARFPEATVSRVRLVVTQAVGRQPRIACPHAPAGGPRAGRLYRLARHRLAGGHLPGPGHDAHRPAPPRPRDRGQRLVLAGPGRGDVLAAEQPAQAASTPRSASARGSRPTAPLPTGRTPASGSTPATRPASASVTPTRNWSWLAATMWPV
jgi:hypothetical protein